MFRITKSPLLQDTSTITSRGSHVQSDNASQVGQWRAEADSAWLTLHTRGLTASCLLHEMSVVHFLGEGAAYAFYDDAVESMLHGQLFSVAHLGGGKTAPTI